MVAGISSSLDTYSYLFGDFQTSISNTQNEINSNSFENIINDVQNTPDVISLDDIQSAGDTTSSSKNSNDMDLNKDGKVSIDEIMKYMELQMQSEENLETSEMQGDKNSQGDSSFSQTFKTPFSQILNAYSAFI